MEINNFFFQIVGKEEINKKMSKEAKSVEIALNNLLKFAECGVTLKRYNTTSHPVEYIMSLIADCTPSDVDWLLNRKRCWFYYAPRVKTEDDIKTFGLKPCKRNTKKTQISLSVAAQTLYSIIIEKDYNDEDFDFDLDHPIEIESS